MRRLQQNVLALSRVGLSALAASAWLSLAPSLSWAQPPNDNFASAQVITGIYGSVTNSNIGATPEPGEPNHAGFAPTNSIWYQWTAPTNFSGEVTLDTFGSSAYLTNIYTYSNFFGGTAYYTNIYTLPLDTVLAVYTGTNLSRLTQIAANDDYYPFVHEVMTTVSEPFMSLDNPFFANYPLPFNGPSIVRFNATAGTTYYIAVDAMSGKGLANPGTGSVFTWLAPVGQGTISFNWAFHPSGLFRFATEEFDFFRSYSSSGLPMPLFQCTEWETLYGLGYPGGETVNNTYYQFDPHGVLVTVTRVAGSSGRMLVDYATQDGTAVANTNYMPVSGTLVFDDFEMSKTLVIPIIPYASFYGSSIDPTITNFPAAWMDKDFYVVLSNPRLDPRESTNVSPPRLDTPFATATVRIMSMAGLGDDPHENWTGDTKGTAPSHDVYNFGKRNYRVPRDVNDFWTQVNIGVLRTHHRETGTANDNGASLHYRVNARVADAISPQDWNNFFPLNPSSDYALPNPDQGCIWIFPCNDTTNFDYTLADGTVTIPQVGYGIISFTVNNDLLTKLNKDFNVVIYRDADNAEWSVGENNECHVTILFDDAKPPAGSVDQRHNADYGINLRPPIATTPPQLPHPGADGVVNDLVIQPDDKTIIVGDFGSYNTIQRNGIARVNFDGSLDDSFDPGVGADGFVSCIAFTSSTNGQMIIGGGFTAFDNNPITSVARVNSDGSLDTTFKPGVPGINGAVWAVAVQSNGKVVIGGDFTSINGVDRNHIARLNSDGSLDSSFDPATNAPNGTVYALALTSGGKIVVGGQFSAVGSLNLKNIVRLNSDGTLDAPYAINLGTGANDTVWDLALQADGKLLLGGDFTSLIGVPRTRIARLNTNGTLDSGFDPGIGADASVFNITPQGNGTIYIGGIFTSFNGTHRLGFARIFADATVDTSFLDTTYNQFAGLSRHYFDDQTLGDPRPFVYASHVQSDGNVIIGGGFERVGGGQADAAIRFGDDYPTNIYNYSVWTEPKARDGVRNRNNVARLIGGSTPGPGNISFLYPNYTVNKSQGFTFVGLYRTNGTLGYASANLSVPPGLAQPGIDYIYNGSPPLYVASWLPDTGLVPYYANVPHAYTRVHSDGLFATNGIPTDIYGHFWFGYSPGQTIVSVLSFSGSDGDRDTKFQLANPVGADQFFLGGANIPVGVALGPYTAPFTIRDDTKKTNYLGFVSASFAVNESGTNALITVVRTNGTAGSCSVTYNVTDGTGHAGINYQGIQPGKLNFSSTVLTQTFLVPILIDHVATTNGYTVNLALSGISGASYGLQNATLYIIDNDGPPGILNFSSATYATNESAGSVVLAVNRSGADKGSLSVKCGTLDGSALQGVNYTATTNLLRWDDLDFSTRFCTVPLLNNGQVGPNTAFQALLFEASINGAPVQGAIGPINLATVTITNDNSFGQLQFSAPSYRVNENGGYATIPVIRLGGSAQTLTVNFSTANGPFTTSSGFSPNFVATSGTLTFPPGVVTTNFTVPIIDDGMVDPPLSNFWFAVRLFAPSQPGALGPQTNVPVYIVDAETYSLPAGSPDTAFYPYPGLDGDVYSVALQPDGKILVGGNFTFANGATRGHIARFNPDATLDTDFLASYAGANAAVQAVAVQSDGRAVLAGSFTSINNISRNRIARVQSDGFFDTSFNQGSGADNTVFALAESFVAGARKWLIGGSFTTVNGSPRARLARLNNDASLDSSFNPTLSANGTVYAIAVYPTNSIQPGKIVIGGDFTTINGTARNRIARLNADGSLDLTFDPGVGASDAIRAVAIQLDGRVIVGGSFTNSFPAPNGFTFNHIARLNLNGSSDVTFNVGPGTDDTVQAIAIQPDNRIFLGGQFLRANGVTRNHITRLMPDGSVDPAINFGAGANGFIDALAIQPDGMILIGGGFTQYDGLSRQHLARIYGGAIDGSGAFEFTSANYQADENSTNTVVTIRRRGGTAGVITLDFATSDGTAVAGVNYSNVGTTVTFPVGETFESVTIPLIHDLQITPDLTVNLSLANPLPPAGLGDQPTATLTILNDDGAINLSSATYAVNQDLFSGVAFIDVFRQGSVRISSSVDFFTLTNGTAIPNLDFTPTNVTLNFLPGQSNLTVRIPILNNPLMANDTTVLMRLTNVNNALLSSPSAAVLTILTTNQAPGQLLFTQTNYVVDEGAGNAILTVVRTNGHIGIISVSYATVAGTAAPGVKYVSTNGVLNFASGEMSKSIAVPIIDENQVEGNQTLTVALSNPSGTSILGSPDATVTIVDNDVGVFFSSPFYIASEPVGNQVSTTVTITVNRIGLQGTTTVNYATTNGTALDGTNYTGTSGALSFAPNEFVKTFPINLLRDTNVTGDLSFTVNLSDVAPPPAQLAYPASALVTILDSDPGIAFTNANFSVLKSATNVLISVLRSNVNTGTVSVDYTTVNGTAIAGTDYQQTYGTLVFSNGIGLQSFSVPIINNGQFQGDRSFSVTLSTNALTGLAQLLPPSTASVTITDDVTAVSFSSPSYSVDENGVAAPITVIRTGYTNSTVSVDYFTADGTGVAGVNYQPTNGTFMFTNGEVSKTFYVSNIDDQLITGDKTVVLNLANIVGAIQGKAVSATLTIFETDGSLIKPAGASLISESGPVNGIIDPGETVSLWFAFRNATGTNTADLVATLVATNGVSTTNGQSQHYGVLVANGPSVSRPFTFTAAGTNGQTIFATFQLRDASTLLSNAVFTFVLGSTTTTCISSNLITINDTNKATPYPATLTVGSVGGTLSNLTVSLNGLYHTYPADIDAILVSPTGLKSYLMAKCGGSIWVENATVTFDDASPQPLTNDVANGKPIVSGTYRPTCFAAAPPHFQPPAPPAPYNTNLSIFKTSSPNGDWSLFIIDDTAFHSGVVSNGWSLSLTSVNPVGEVADLVTAVTGSPNPVTVTSNITYSISVTNFGPSVATNVFVTNSLAPSAVFVPSESTANVDTSLPGFVVFHVGPMAKDAFTNLTVTTLTTVSNVTLANLVWAFGGTPDPNPLNNTNQTLIDVDDFIADIELQMAVAPDPVSSGGNLTYTITVFNHGPSTAPDLSVSNYWLPPNSATFVSASPGGYIANGNVVLFTNLGSLPAGGQTNLTISTHTLSSGLITNTAYASSTVADSAKGNNTDSAKAQVLPVTVSSLVASQAAGSFSFHWRAAANTSYVVESTDDLAHPNWSPVTSPPAQLSGDTYTFAVPATNGSKFFRIRASVP